MKRVLASLAIAAAAVLLAGCAAGVGRASPVGSWGTPDSSGQNEPGLELADDGRVSGNDGCNRLMGQWTETDGQIEFGAFASTMMFCDGVDTWLLGASSARIEGETLVVLDQAGAELGTLTRAS